MHSRGPDTRAATRGNTGSRMKGGASTDGRPRIVFPTAVLRRQLFFMRYVSWQPPQFLMTVPNAALNVSRSFTIACCARASVPSLTNLALKSGRFVHIPGRAAVSRSEEHTSELQSHSD